MADLHLVLLVGTIVHDNHLHFLSGGNGGFGTLALTAAMLVDAHDLPGVIGRLHRGFVVTWWRRMHGNFSAREREHCPFIASIEPLVGK
jgi:hypothetical protein